MKKLNTIIMVAIAALVLTACTPKSTEVAFDLSAVYLTDNVLDFEFYLERSDLSLKQPKNSENLAVDNLPESLRPVAITGEGVSCDVSVLPHMCTADVAVGNKIALKVEFADGGVTEQSIAIPTMEGLSAPEILAPNEESTDNSVLKFSEIGADRYELAVSLCYPYADDGINPCLDGDDYIITKDEEDKFVLDDDDMFYFAELFKRGEALEVNFDFDLEYYDSVVYEVKAFQVEEKNEVTLYMGASAKKEIVLGEVEVVE